MQAEKQPRKKQTHRKINVRFVYDITSDQETNMDQQSGTSAPLRSPNTLPKVLTCGRGRGKFPLANWTSATKGCGHRHNRGCDISQAPPLLNSHKPLVERNLAAAAPTDRVLTYEGNLAPSKCRKDLANWTWVGLGNTRTRLTNNNRMEQRQWQRPNDNTDDRSLDETGDHAESVEGDTIPSDEERPGRSLEDLE